MTPRRRTTSLGARQGAPRAARKPRPLDVRERQAGRHGNRLIALTCNLDTETEEEKVAARLSLECLSREIAARARSR